MLQLWTAIVILTTAASSFGQTPSTQPAPVGRKILIIGDSLTEGLGVSPKEAFPAVLEEILRADGCPNCSVVNSGTSGSTSAGARKRLEWQLKGKDKPTILILALGANDGLRGISVETTRKNLEEVIELANTHSIKVLLAGMLVPPNYGKDYARDFAAIFPELAKKHKTALIPFLLDGVAGNPKMNLPDGIHPNAAGYRIVAALAAKHVKELL
jgi:acyl-CoA thioesterase-1